MILDVAGNIRRLRVAAHLTQSQLAELACLSRVTIAKYESGSVEPGAQALSRIACALGVTADALLYSEDQELPEPQIRTPRTVEAKILSAGIDKMPEKERERALSLMRQIFEQYADFFEEDSDDT